MTTLRVVGDVHGQIHPDDLLTGKSRAYLELIADAPFSVQVGDMGDGETYAQLIAHVDPERHRFFPGNHDHHGQFPPHCLGDFGSATLGGVNFFFIRGAASADREHLVDRGRKLGRTLWYEQEELTDEQMRGVEREYLQVRPAIVLSHDAPADAARFAWHHACQQRWPNPGAVFRPSRTNVFLERLLGTHAPRLWLFGHHHHDCRYREGQTLFVCVGELSHVDIDPAGEIHGP